MNRSQIVQILNKGTFPEPCHSPELIETHISWVLLTERFAYKIKKPVKLSFLDFSTLSQRNYYCRREIMLNERLSQGIYLQKVPIMLSDNVVSIGIGPGQIIDYAVKMKRMPAHLQMNTLLKAGEVQAAHIASIARVLAQFHQESRPISVRHPAALYRIEFNDLAHIHPSALEAIPRAMKGLIPKALIASDQFLEEHSESLDTRCELGYFRDCHGDLHSGNIFLTHPPILFDCIEFNDELRHIDILNEVAFLCMDLEFHQKLALSAEFLEKYCSYTNTKLSAVDQHIFLWYKMYRANIRAKIYLIRYQTQEKATDLETAIKYLQLMGTYTKELAHTGPPSIIHNEDS